MKADIISIGDELLIGQVTNTNSVWMAQQLNLIGIHVRQILTVSDEKQAIYESLKQACDQVDFVFITGGLGPTKDDITKKIFAEYFNTILETDEEVLEHVKSFFKKRNREINTINSEQALIPKGCIVLHNANGTAPGMWMTKNNTHYISLPGVPYEMQGIMTDYVFPKIKAENTLPYIYHQTVMTQGLGESFLAAKIESWEDNLRNNHIKLAYLPQPGVVRLRLSTTGKNKEELVAKVNQEIEKLHELIPEYIFGTQEINSEDNTLEKIVSQLLRSAKQTLSIAESCTGGYLATLITSLPGSSDVFKGGIIPYQNEIKNKFLEVDNSIFKTVGAVSEECVKQMASNCLVKFNSDFAIATSGIAGPAGGTEEKPVGTVWIGIASKEKVYTKKFRFGDNRVRNIQMTAKTAFNLLRKFMINEI